MPSVAGANPTGNVYVDGVLSGVKWAVNSLTFSFPTDPSYYGPIYGSGEPSSGFVAFNAVQQAAVRTILAEYSSVINFTFTEITETSTQHADLRYAESSQPSTAWTYYPSSAGEGGDSWYSSSGKYANPVVGNYAWMTILHETGHAMGLKHPHETSGSFGIEPADHDSEEYTVMSYRSYLGGPTTGLTNEAYGFPQTLMMLDVAGLQAMYGANYSTNAGDTVYKWDPLTGQEFVNGVSQGLPGANRIFMNVWDGGGHDTYDFSNYTTNLSINLNPGAWTITSTGQLAYLGNGHYAVGNISNSLLYQGNTASEIDDAIGGTGNDTIIGNDINNKLTGGHGNDTLDGGAGIDTAVYSGMEANYQLVHNTDGSWTVTDLRNGTPDGVDTLKNIELVQFSDKTVSLDTVGTPPTLQIPTIASFSNDSGTVGDAITNDNTLTFTGAATAGSMVKVFDGTTLLGSVTADSTGTWTFTTAVLADGSHVFTASASDGSGNTTSPSPTFPVTIDTVAPTTPTITSVSPDSNVVGDGVTNANTLTLHGQAQAGSIVHVYDGSTLLGTTVADTSGAWNYTTFDPSAMAPAFICMCAACVAARAADQTNQDNGTQNGPSSGGTTTVLTDGVHSFTVLAKDIAGNASAASSVLNITVDTVAPNAPTITPFSNDSGVTGDHITNDNTLTLTGTAEANSSIKIFDGATQIGTAAANASGAWTYTTSAVADGAHNFAATATDAAGNTSVASTTLAVTVDTVAPTAPVIASFSPDTNIVGDGLTSANQITVTGTAEANSTVKIYDGATLLGSATTNATGAWTFATATLINGTHNFTATAADAAGNTGAASAALSVTVNNVAPTAPTITSFSNDSGVVGDGITNDNTLTVAGTAAANTTIKIFDGASQIGAATANASGAWTFTTTTLADGGHSFTATAMDAAGNTSAASSALAVIVDTTIPNAPVIASFSNDSGVVGDGITNDSTLTLAGTAEANATVKVFDGATQIGTATANASGAWTYTTAALSDGAHSLSAIAVDAAGNASGASSNLAVTIDTAAPAVPAITSMSNDSGVIGDGITNDNTLTLAGTAAANSTVKVFDGATQIATVTANAAGAWTFTTATLADGTHSFTATATDVAGNTSALSSALAVRIDTAAPNAPVIAGFSPDSGIVGDGITNANQVVITGSAEANSTVQVYEGTTLLGTAVADANGVWNLSTAPLANGTHAFTAKATDAAGNVSAVSAALSVTVMSASASTPTVTSFTPDSAVVGDGLTNANHITLMGTAIAYSTVQIFDGTKLLGTVAANGSGIWTYATQPLSDGAHAFTVKATDAAGNISDASTALTVTVDTTAPNAPAVASLVNDTGVAGDGVTKESALILSGGAEAGSTVQIYDGATLLGTTAANAKGGWTFTTAALSDGAHAFVAKATDAAGNVSTSSSALAVTIDSVAPLGTAITSYSNDTGVAGDGVTSNNTLVLTGVAEANSTVKIFDGGKLAGTVTADAAGTWTFSTAQLADGAHAFTAIATDLAGNVGATSAVLNVTVDTVAPNAPTSLAFTPDYPNGAAAASSTQLANGVVDTGYLTLSGVAEANSTVKVFDGAKLLGTVTASSTGAWQLDTGKLTDGAHSFSAIATDAAGNAGIASAALSVTINTAPDAPSIVSFSPDVGVVGDGITSAQVITLAGTAEANFVVKVYEGTTLLGQTVANASGNWNFTTGTLANGVHAFTATAVDAVGDTSATSSALTVTIDPNAPADHAATVTANATNVARGQSIALSSLFTATDVDHDAITQYHIYDASTAANSGYFVINGVAQTAGTPITVSASQLSQISFQSGVGNDDLYVQAFDGQIWGGWTKLSVNVANHLADVTANSMTVARGQSVSATSLFSVSDADNDAIVQYHFLDSSGAANGGHFMLNGVDQGAQSNFTISASQLSQLNFQTGVGSDTLYVQVFDGYGWSNWTQLHVDIANQVAVVTADPATVARGQSVSAASLFSVSDANNDSIIQYHFLDTSNAANSGHFVLNGVDQGAQSNFTISASQLAQLNFQTGVGSDTIYVQAFDGYGWSNWTQLHADVANHTAVASANTVSAGRGQSISAASLFSVTDADGDAVTQYQFYENTTAPTSGHFSINGIDQTMQGTINVSASQLAQTTFLTGSATDTLYVRAFDGYGWGDWTVLHLDVTENAPVIGAATTVVNAGETVAASSLFSVTDADNDAITEYQVWDHTASAASGHFVMNGVAQDAQTVIDMSAANLSQLNFQGGQLSDELYVRAFDGTMWSDWTQINVGPGTASVAPNSPVSIVGTAGNDILVSGTGSATMTGGGGADTFVFVQNFGTDTIADFQATGTSHGTLEFSQATFADLASVLAHATQVGTDVVIAADQHNSVTLKNVALANLTSSDIHII